MENNRPKVSSLTEKELAALLQESFFKVGKELKLPANETKVFLDEVYKYQGWMFVDTFNDAFSRYAACEIPEAENLRPHVSPMFISKLMKIYFRRCNEKKFIRKSVKDTISLLKPEEKYILFIKHILANQLLPANPDWISIYEHLSTLQKINKLHDWDSLSYTKKLKHATVAVCEWAYKNYPITENLSYKYNPGQSPLRGIGSRLGETLR